MGILTTAYALVWIAVALYVGWLGLQQRRIARQLRDLQSQGDPASQPVRRSKAA